MDNPTFLDLLRVARTEALARNPRLSMEEVTRQGSNIDILLAGASAMGDEVMGQLASLRSDLFIGTARGAALDRLITDRYPELTRKQASPSYGYVDFSFSPVVGAAFTIPEGTVLSTADGVQFLVTEAHSVGIGLASIRVAVRSALAGSTQKASAGKIRNLTSTIPSAPATGMTVSNVAATFGGEDQELDGDYAIRYRLYYLAARRATSGAIEQAILAIPGVVKATVIENLDVHGRPIGYVQAVVADSYTEQFVTSSTLPATYATQLASLRAQIETLLSEWRASGVAVTVTFGQIVVQPIRLSLSYLAGSDEEAVRNIVLTTLIQKVNSLRPGQSLVLEELRTLLRSISGLYYTGGEIISPSGNIVPLPQQVLRTSTTFTTVLS